MRNFRQEVEELLVEAGGLYTFQDLLDNINNGTMQSFSDGQSWIVTQVSQFPRRKIVELVLGVGNLENLYKLAEEVEKFARAEGATMLFLNGREGWSKIHPEGWRKVSVNMVKDLT